MISNCQKELTITKVINIVYEQKKQLNEKNRNQMIFFILEMN